MRFSTAVGLLGTAALLSACGQGDGFAGGIRSYAYYVYVANQGSSSSGGTITPFAILGTGHLFPLTEVPAGGNGTSSIAIHPSMAFVYALNATSSSIGVFSINATNGSLAQVSLASTPSSCSSLSVDPSARYLYVACSSQIATLDLTGGGAALGNLRTSPSGSAIAYAIQADPNGRYVYAASRVSSKATSYAVTATGTLTLISSVSTGTSPQSLAVDPKGRFLATANIATSDVTMVSVNAASGALTTVGSTSAGAGANPKGVAIAPSGSFVYAVGNSTDSVSAFSVQADFSLLSLASYTTDLLPTAMAFSSDGAYAVVVNSGSSNDIYLYAAGASGVLTYADQGAADAQPSGAAIARLLAPAAL